MQTEERRPCRASFDAIADIYDAGRPSYPDELYDDLLSSIEIPTGTAPEVLEVGCGTGQASRSLVERSCVVTAVELGSHLAAKARENLAAFGDQFRVIVGDFEKVKPPAGSFDLVVSASAFHWLNPTVGFPKVVHLLRPTGALALWGMGNAHTAMRRVASLRKYAISMLSSAFHVAPAGGGDGSTGLRAKLRPSKNPGSLGRWRFVGIAATSPI